MGLFDAYLFVDWSARQGPGPAAPCADAIWSGELSDDGECQTYHRTRRHAAGHVRGRLVAHVGAGRRVLVGFDFPYGYPAGLASFVARDGAPPWRAVWDRLTERITDDEQNRNNRFEVAADLNRLIGCGPGPFWGCPPGEEIEGVLTRRMNGLFGFPFHAGPAELRRLRRTEAAMPGVQETWKLMGAGAVGSQALVGIPYVHRLRVDPDLARHSAVWPFETGFVADPVGDRRPSVLHVEIWPGIVDAEALAECMAAGDIQDQAQVRLMCRWARDQDADGTLGGWLAPPGLQAGARDAAEREEGWILGCPAPAPAP